MSKLALLLHLEGLNLSHCHNLKTNDLIEILKNRSLKNRSLKILALAGNERYLWHAKTYEQLRAAHLEQLDIRERHLDREIFEAILAACLQLKKLQISQFNGCPEKFVEQPWIEVSPWPSYLRDPWHD